MHTQETYAKVLYKGILDLNPTNLSQWFHFLNRFWSVTLLKNMGGRILQIIAQ